MSQQVFPGDYLTITATSTNASDVAASIVWIEDV